MNLRVSFWGKFLIFICILLFSAINSTVLAAENSLLGIDVQQNSSGQYNIQLKTNNNIKIKKLSDSNDNMTVILSSTIPSDSLDIIYDNASDLKNIIVQKKNIDNTVILLQGKNITNSTFYIKDITTGTIKPIDINNKSLDNKFLYVADKKFLVYSLSACIFLFVMMIIFRPRDKKYKSNDTYYVVKSKKYISNNTLRSKNLSQKQKLPSIHYNVNTKYYNKNISRPAKITINQQIIQEQIQKAG